MRQPKYLLTSSYGKGLIKINLYSLHICNSPPDGCLQYQTGLTGRFSSFNWADSATTVHLASQTQNLCIRQEAGYCCVQYQVLDIPLPSFEKSSSSYSKYIMQKCLFCKL